VCEKLTSRLVANGDLVTMSEAVSLSKRSMELCFEIMYQLANISETESPHTFNFLCVIFTFIYSVPLVCCTLLVTELSHSQV
jgi:hypothetical protein